MGRRGTKEGAEPDEGEPRRGEPKSGSAQRRDKHDGPYTPEQRCQAVEAYLKSGMTREDFGKTWGVGVSSLSRWVELYQEGGPKALATNRIRKDRKPGRKRLAVAVRDEISAVKREFPDFGLRKVRDFLVRFKAVKVSTGSIRRTLKEAGVPPTPKPRKKSKRHVPVRRFERARPMQLWQSDITTLWLAKQSRHVYLTVFLDDHSRYVVSWGLQLQQKQELVTETLLEGIQRFGKPEEVLTDQGRQYVSWRGKSDFRRLLEREGIQHVVSRTHHPETLGKCERLWETIGKELWERVMPADLEEAKARLAHYFQHYNHFRPHQGLEGMVPADRFFGVESEVRKTLEAAMAKNALLIALGEKPRTPVFLIGQIGDQRLSMHGEQGKLVIQTPEGNTRTLTMDGLGNPQAEGGARHDQGGDDHGGEGRRQEHASSSGLQDAAEAGGGGEGPVGGSASRGAGAGAQDGGGADAELGGAQEPEPGGRGAGGAAIEDLAVEPAGLVRHGGGTLEAAPRAEGNRDGSGRGPEGFEEAHPAAGAGAGDGEAADRDSEGSSGEPAPDRGSETEEGQTCEGRNGIRRASGAGSADISSGGEVGGTESTSDSRGVLK